MLILLFQIKFTHQNLVGAKITALPHGLWSVGAIDRYPLTNHFFEIPNQCFNVDNPFPDPATSPVSTLTDDCVSFVFLSVISCMNDDFCLPLPVDIDVASKLFWTVLVSQHPRLVV